MKNPRLTAATLVFSLLQFRYVFAWQIATFFITLGADFFCFLLFSIKLRKINLKNRGQNKRPLCFLFGTEDHYRLKQLVRIFFLISNAFSLKIRNQINDTFLGMECLQFRRVSPSVNFNGYEICGSTYIQYIRLTRLCRTPCLIFPRHKQNCEQ